MISQPLRYLKAAALHPVSLSVLGAGGLLSLGVGEAALLVAGGVELVWLGLVSGNRRFRRAVDAREEAKRRRTLAARTDRLLAELAPNQREHWQALRVLADRIEANHGRIEGGSLLLAESRAKVEALLGAFLRLMVTLNDHRRYLGATDRRRIEEDLAELRRDLDREGGEPVREIKRKRVEILEKRLARFHQAEEGREVIAHQLASIEDVLRLVHEGSIAMRDPAAITRQLDALTVEVEATEATVREMERFLGLAAELEALPSARRV